MMRRLLDTRRILTAILAFQLALAAGLFANDILRAASLGRLLPGLAPDAPPMERPTAPGDQTRRYDPSPAPARQPGTRPFPGKDYPDRLAFEVVEDGANRRVEIYGTIDHGAAERFESWLETLPDPPGSARLDSPGGSVSDALAIGRRIRAAEMATSVADGALCMSACPYIFAGGTQRQAATDARIGVHQHYYGENTILPAFLAVRDIQTGQARVMAYLTEMGIDLRVMEPALRTPPESIYILEPAELQDYRLTTEAAASPA